MSPWTHCADALLEPVATTRAERLAPWKGPVVFFVALVVAAALGWPFVLAVFLGPWWADWRTP